MDARDLELKLCSKDPVFIDGVPIYPIALRTIAEAGYSRFNAEMRLLCLTADDIKALTGDDISQVGIFTYLIANALKDRELMRALVFWLTKITRSRIAFSERRLCFTGGAFDITAQNFDEIQTVIRYRNGLHDVEEEADNPDNDVARRVLMRRKEERMKRRKARRTDDGAESEITLSDLISILASGLGMTMQEIMEYDLYQFNDQFNRLKIMDDYEVSVQALLHGARKEDVNLTHWLTKIKHNEED